MRNNVYIQSITSGSAGPLTEPAGPGDGAAGSDAVPTLDLLDYVASFSDDFAKMAQKSQLPRLSLLLDMVADEAKRERARQG